MNNNQLRTKLYVAKKIETVSLQNTSAVGNGLTYSPTEGNASLTFTISGTSTARSVIFELADPSGVYLPLTAIS